MRVRRSHSDDAIGDFASIKVYSLFRASQNSWVRFSSFDEFLNKFGWKAEGEHDLSFRFCVAQVHPRRGK